MRAIPWGLWLLGLAIGCGRKAPPPVAPLPLEVAEPMSGCPNPVWQVGQLRPAEIELVNQSADSVLVFMDRCRGHSRVGHVGPLESAIVALPNGAVAYHGSIRFFTYRGRERRSGVELLAPFGQLRLVIPEAARPECPEVWVNGTLVADLLSRIPRETIESVQYLREAAPGECSRILVKLKSPAPESVPAPAPAH